MNVTSSGFVSKNICLSLPHSKLKEIEIRSIDGKLNQNFVDCFFYILQPMSWPRILHNWRKQGCKLRERQTGSISLDLFVCCSGSPLFPSSPLIARRQLLPQPASWLQDPAAAAHAA